MRSRGNTNSSVVQFACVALVVHFLLMIWKDELVPTWVSVSFGDDYGIVKKHNHQKQ